MKSNNEKQWEKAFKADMKVFEDAHHFRVPHEDELLTTLQQFKEKRKKAFVREFIVFFITALMIFTSYAVIALKLTTVFIWIQAIALFVFPMLLLFEHRRKTSRGEVFRDGSE